MASKTPKVPKVAKLAKAKKAPASEIELQAAQALNEISQSADYKEAVAGLVIRRAFEVSVAGNKKAIVIFVPFKQLPKYRKVQERLIREFEKKFSGAHVVFIAERKILSEKVRSSLPAS